MNTCRILLLSCLIFCGRAWATDTTVFGVGCVVNGNAACPGMEDGLTTATLLGGHTYIYISGYYAPGDGGQGEFKNIGTGSCGSDGGSQIQDNASPKNCWQRLNLDGSVEQFGAVPASSGDNSANNSATQFSRAFAAASAAHLGAVYVKGNQNGSRYYLNGGTGSPPALIIPPRMKLQCLTAPAGQAELISGTKALPSGYYGDIPFTLIIPSTQTILLGQASQLQGCEIQQAGLATPPTTTGPTYQNLVHGTTGTGGTASLAGTAITLGSVASSPNGTADNAEVRDTAIIGFNTGIYSNGNSDIKIDNVTDDSTRCVDLEKEIQGVATIDGLYCYGDMSRQVAHQLTGGGSYNVDLVNLFVSNVVTNGTAGYTITFTTPCSTSDTTGDATDCNNYPIGGDTGWLTDPGGMESAKGRWALTNCATSSTPAHCDLNGLNTSSVGGIATFDAGAKQIVSLPPNSAGLSLIQQGMVFGYNSQNHLIKIRVVPTVSGVPPNGAMVVLSGLTSDNAPEVNGTWIVTNSDTTHFTFELQGSVFVNTCGGGGSQPSCSGTVSWGYPSVGQNVSGAGIASGTTVTIVWPTQNIVFLSNSTTMAKSSTALTYSDNSFGFGGAITAVYPCTVNTRDICLTVGNTHDLIDGAADINVSGAMMSMGTNVNQAWKNVSLGDGATHSPATTIDLPCPSIPSGNCFVFGDSYGGGGTYTSGYLRLVASERFGDAVYLQNARNAEIVNFQTFQHLCGLHFATQTAYTRAVNVEVDQDDFLEDPVFCGLKFDGTSKGNVVTNGAVDVAAGSIVAAPTATNASLSANSVQNVRLGGTAGAGASQTMFDIEGGNGSVSLGNLASEGPGNAFVADGNDHAALTNLQLPKVDLHYQTVGSALVNCTACAQVNTVGSLNLFNSNTPVQSSVPYAADSHMDQTHATPMAAMIDNVNTIGANGYAVAFADAADGSGKCHTVMSTAVGGHTLTIFAMTGTPDQINGGVSVSLSAGKMGIYCTYQSGSWWGGPLG